MSRSPWSDPPITGTPLDYVPIDAPRVAATSTRFSAPFVKRAILAGLIAAAIISLAAFPKLGLVAIALGVISAMAWGGQKLGDRVEAGSMWPPNPHSWWPAIVAALAIVAILYFS